METEQYNSISNPPTVIALKYEIEDETESDPVSLLSLSPLSDIRKQKTNYCVQLCIRNRFVRKTP